MIWLLLVGLAHAQCGSFEFQGIPRIIDGKMKLVINEKTRSEIVISPSVSDEGKLAPYLNLAVKGEVSVRQEVAPRRFNASSFGTLDYGVEDPINHMKNSYMNLKVGEKCL